MVRVVLVVAIAAVAAATFVVHRALEDKRDAAAEAREDPEARAVRALRLAEKAAVGQHDPQATRVALLEASAALDVALRAAPTEARWLRARLAVTDRLGDLAARTGRSAEAFDWRVDADRRAAALLAAAPGDDGTRVERLAAAQKLADAWAGRSQPERVRAVVEAGAHEVESALDQAAPSVTVRSVLAHAWLRAARLSEPAASLKAFERALAHQEAVAGQAPDTRAARLDLAATFGEASDRAQEAKDAERAARWEGRALVLLEEAVHQQKGDAPTERLLAGRHLVAAERAAARGDEAAARLGYDRALALRRARVAAVPTDQDARRDLVVGLNYLGAFHSGARRDPEAIAAYGEAAAAAREMKRPDALDAPAYEAYRVRLVVLGNHAQILGRADRTAEARTASAEAFTLATELAEARRGEPQSVTDLASAGLRHARLLRAPPNPQRAEARRVARECQSRLAVVTGARADEIRQGLRELLAELGP